MTIHICGGTKHWKVMKKRPKDWREKGYKIKQPYFLKWRAKLGRARCDCTEVIEVYQPWYGTTLSHAEGCAILKHIERYPGMNNFMWERVLIR